MRARTIVPVALALVFSACGDGRQEMTAPAIAGIQPRLAYFPQDVATILNISDSVLEHVRTPNITRTSDNSYNSSSGSVAWHGVFYPATRVVSDTFFTVSITKWSWDDQFNYPHTCSDLNCGFSAGVHNLKLTYHMKVVAPVRVGSIGGPPSVPTMGPYTWSVSPAGGDVAEAFSVVWRMSTDGGSSWTPVGSGYTYSRDFTEATFPNFVLRAVATNSGRADSTTRSIAVANPLQYGQPTIASFSTDPSPPVQYTPFTVTINGAQFDPAIVQIVYSQPCWYPAGSWCQGGVVQPGVATSTRLVASAQVFGSTGPTRISVRNGPSGNLSSPVEMTIQPRY